MEDPVLNATEQEKNLHDANSHHRSHTVKSSSSSSSLAAKPEEPGISENSQSSSSEGSLPTVRGSVPFGVWLVQGLILLERAAFYGVSQPFQNYLQLPTDNATRPGALGLGQSRATLIIYVWFIYSYLTPLLGGLISDCWLGRRKTIRYGYIFYTLGLALLVTTAFTQRIYGKGGLPGFIVALLLMGGGTGLVKPNMLVFLVDQCPEEEPVVVKQKDGSAAITDRELTIQYIYNANYWATNLGCLCGIITTIVEQHAGFGYCFLVSLLCIVIAAILFLIRYTKFVTAPPAGNVLVTVLKVIRRRKLERKNNSSPTITQAPREEDQVAHAADNKIVSEAKTALRACLVFLPFPALMLSINLMDSGLIAQAGEMETHGLPNDIMYNLNPISVMVILPFIQGWLYPFLHKRKIPFTKQQRIAVGLFFAAIAMGYSAGVQQIIYSAGPCFNHPLKCLSGNIPNEVNVGIQTPTYVFLGVAEILAIVAGTELAYTKAPASMKSIVQAIFMFFSSLGSVLGVGISFAAYDPNMVIVYSSVTALLLLSTLGFEIAILNGHFT